MEFVPELTARLENKPGRLAKVCEAMAKEKINIRALSVMDSEEQAVLRMVVDQLEPTRKALTSLGVEHEVREVLAVEIDNRPGALTKILERLADEHINIEYVYVSAATAPGRSLGIFHTSNPKRAMQIVSDTVSNAPPRDPGRRPLHTR